MSERQPRHNAVNHTIGNRAGAAHRKIMERSVVLLPEAEECMNYMTERLNKLKELIENDGQQDARNTLSLINSALFRYSLYEEKRDRRE